ncbi:MAG: hypothetical protein KAS12_07200 [Candidatus Aenigmarchaeota archaeon]|nr:hypothetical protein [Candidatus Aenigmarchaeota archaeon]
MNTEFTLSDMNTACTAGDLDQIKYLHEHGCSVDADAYASVVEGDHLDCIEYLCENGCKYMYQRGGRKPFGLSDSSLSEWVHWEPQKVI